LEGSGQVRPIDDPEVIRQFLELLEAEQPDVLAVVGWVGKGTRCFKRWARKHNTKLILMLAGNQHDRKRNWIKELYKRWVVLGSVQGVICGGKSHKAYALQLGFDEQRIRLGYNSVDNAFWKQHNSSGNPEAIDSGWLKQHGLEHQRYFVAVGRFIEKKNFLGLIEAYSEYVKGAGQTPWGLVLIGDGDLRPSYEAAIRSHGLEGQVQLPGYLSTAEIGPWFASAGAFVLPSSHAEQWGLVVNEAMAAGLPVIVSNICGCTQDLVLEGQTGYAFDPASEGALVACLEKMAASQAQRDRMAAASAEHIEGYSPERFATNFLELSEQITA
jgi:glycosyltransferase involved in cell wall biosynthesis